MRDYETDRMLRVAFPLRVAYLVRDESDLEGEASRSQGLGRGCFYRVSNSEFEARFRADTIRHDGALTHFAIVTDAHCVDILAQGEAVVQEL